MGELSNSDIVFWLNNLGFSNAIIDKFIGKVDNMSDLLLMDKVEIMQLEVIDNKGIEYLMKNRDPGNIINEIEKYHDMGVNILTVYDAQYPERLKYIDDNPKILYVKGSILPNDFYSIAIVGSRKTTEYGKEAASYFSKELAKNNITIVSGMANGVDSFAHKAALNIGGRTIAVLGTGVNVIYPRKNLKLYDEIIENGAVVSEYPINTKGKPYHFPQRNRIVSGLALGVIVVEAQKRSGSLITARLAAEQGREVFAVPGNINSLYSQGTNALIRDGAILLTNWEDVVDEIDSLRDYVIKSKNSKDNIELTMEEILILKTLDEGEADIDRIIEKTGLDIQSLQSFLTILELKDMIISTRIGTYLKKI